MIQLKNQRQKLWHVVYTRSRAEKKVQSELTLNEIENFLPLQKRLRQWKDRKKWVEMPLMPGYCFVHISRNEYEKVLKTSNVVCYITFEGKAAVIPEKQINALKLALKQNDFEVTVTTENYKPGKKVEVIAGPLIGLQGELVEARGKNKFMLRFEQINNSFLIEVPAENLTLIPEK
ncbi:MAG: UpxY family transcription antiterminator [Prolixibacteraceae bacterium]|nr:UpxY family transcription antiterminator [Prolixibacteraceae bacterium]